MTDRAGSDVVRSVVLAGHQGDHAAARRALGDPDPTVRAAALGALARCQRLDAADLAAGLSDPDPQVRRRAAEEAGRARDPALADALIAALADIDDLVAEAASSAIGELEHPPASVVAPLAAIATTHREVVVRETAVAALGSLAAAGRTEGRDAILAATHDVATVRRRAALALAPFDDDDVEQTLRRLRDDRDRQTRQAAEDLLQDWHFGDEAP